jgi:FAD/FMN-containing dehydrogenase
MTTSQKTLEPQPAVAIANDTLLAQLAEIVGADRVSDDPARRTFFATDLAGSGHLPAAVVEVGSTAELAQVVTACSLAEVAMTPRGGGFSYTGGYTPSAAASVTIDLRGIDQVFEINETDMYVRVGVGCTWHNLYNALKARGLRTPYFGPMSGYGATVGGALSQGSFFLGSTEYGTVMESVLSIEMVLADGSIIHTGSDSAAGVAPFYRNYGPDLTGLFLADTGALGFKAVATLKLIQFPPHQAYGSFAFATGPQAVAALSEIARAGLAAEAYAWDPYFVKIMSEASGGTRQDLAFLLAVIRNGAGLVDGLRAGLRTALAGKRVFRPSTHLLQVTIDDHSAAGAAERLRQVRRIAGSHGGQEVAPSVPRALRAMPFTNFNVPERRTALRNLPTNSIYPHSVAPAAHAAIEALFARHAAEMERRGVSVGTVFFGVGKSAMCIEPLIYWDDEDFLAHDRIAQTSDVTRLARQNAPSETTVYAQGLRNELKAVMHEHGAVHVQIGRAYDLLGTREPRVAALLQAIKRTVDSQRLVNPGSLGL